MRTASLSKVHRPLAPPSGTNDEWGDAWLRSAGHEPLHLGHRRRGHDAAGPTTCDPHRRLVDGPAGTTSAAHHRGAS